MLQRSMPYLTAVALLAFSVAPASAEKQTLRMMSWPGPAEHHMVKAQEVWIKTVEEASGGNLSIELDKSASAGTGSQYDLVKSGARDLAWHAVAQTPGRFQMLLAGELPLLCPHATACSAALWAWYEKNNFADKEFSDTKLLTVFVQGLGAIHALKSVKALDEIKGIKIAAIGGGVPTVQALGMSAVAMPAVETHGALSRGAVDAVLLSYDALESFRLKELTKSHMEVRGGLHMATFALVMNKEAFAKLTPGNQKALTDASKEPAAALFGKAWDEADGAGRAGALDRGDIIQQVAAADEVGRWKDVLKPVRDEWLKKVSDRGLDAEALLKELEGFIKCRGPTHCMTEGP
jgi:TRAP-type transport system periplasmic protein